MTRRRVALEERCGRLGRRHHLSTPASSPLLIAGDLLGLHSSDPATVFLSVWARAEEGFVTADLECELYEQRSLLRLHGMRRTMFVAPLDLASVIDVSCTRSVAVSQRARLLRLLSGAVPDPAAWYDHVSSAVSNSLAIRGEALASDIREDVPELALVVDDAGGPTPVISRALFQMAVERVIVRTRPRGSWRSSQYRWALMDAWVPEPLPQLDAAEAENELVIRWLRSFGPATIVDVGWWTGWGTRRAGRVLDRIDAVEVDLDERTGYLLADDLEVVSQPDSWVALLPGLDPTTMGWKERRWYLGDHGASLFDRNGNAGPTVWLDGRVVGAWAQTRSGSVVVELLEDVGSDASARIVDEAHRLESWLSGQVVIPRFRVPIERRLSE